MVVSPLSAASGASEGVRPINLHRDLAAIADLIDEAFHDELDASGLASLREMRTMARLGPLLYLLLPSGGELGGFYRGYVWESDGKIVGNVTIQPLDDYGRRWMIANVAVQKNYQRRGIGRALMMQALDRIRQSGGRWAVLQVRESNEVACALYRKMGFEQVLIETHLRAFEPSDASEPAAPSGLALAPVRDEHWKKIQKLLRASLPSSARWWRDSRTPGFYRNSASALGRFWGRLTGQGWRIRLGVWQAEELKGVLDVDIRLRGEHRLDLLLHPSLRGRVEPWLVARGLSILREGHPFRPIAATLFDYQQYAIEAMRERGFQEVRSLVTMRKSMQE
ncbi:MAG: GNAT family N-acetyltransferase [Chloroflexi bacterium]|nr:GNAT family N-acetyltransferase [Chloroflexota bacterium]